MARWESLWQVHRSGLVLPLVLLLVVAFVLVAPLVSASAAAGALDPTASEILPVQPSAEGEGDDPFHVSGDELAVAIFLPGIFLIATAGLIAWAWRSRSRDSEGDG